MNCIFCNLEKDRVILENELVFGIMDKYPINKGHMLFIPRRHFKIFFDATKEEIHAIYSLLHEGKKYLDEKYHPDGYNLGVNIGEDAGQSIMHLHVHLIPRYKGDVVDPTGGVRCLKGELTAYREKL